jgi:hypothetical protein
LILNAISIQEWYGMIMKGDVKYVPVGRGDINRPRQRWNLLQTSWRNKSLYTDDK